MLLVHRVASSGGSDFRRSVLTVALSLALAGCGGTQATNAPGQSAVPTAGGVGSTLAASPAATGTPGISIAAPTPCPSADRGPQPALEPIEAGIHTITAMEPNFTVTVPSGFSAYRLPALFILAPTATPELQLAITQAFANFGDLARNRFVKVAKESDVTVGGVEGKAADFEIAKERCDPARIFRATRAGQALNRESAGYAEGHMIILNVGDPMTVIEYDADSPEAFAALQTVVEPIIASIKFSP